MQHYGYTRELMPDGRYRLLPDINPPRPPVPGQLPLFQGLHPVMTVYPNYAVIDDDFYIRSFTRTDGSTGAVNVHGLRRPGSNSRMHRKVECKYRVKMVLHCYVDDENVLDWIHEESGVNYHRRQLADRKMRLRGARKQRAARLHAKLNLMDLREEVLKVTTLSGEVVGYDTVRNREPVGPSQGTRTTPWTSWRIPASKRLANAARDAALERLEWADPDGDRPAEFEAVTVKDRKLSDLERRIKEVLGL